MDEVLVYKERTEYTLPVTSGMRWFLPVPHPALQTPFPQDCDTHKHTHTHGVVMVKILVVAVVLSWWWCQWW